MLYQWTLAFLLQWKIVHKTTSNSNIMITIDNTQFSSNLSLPSILVCMTKVQMIDICKKLDLYVSPNLKKEETARRLAAAMLDEPLNILHQLCKNELQLLDEIVKAGPNQYVIRKIRKTPTNFRSMVWCSPTKILSMSSGISSWPMRYAPCWQRVMPLTSMLHWKEPNYPRSSNFEWCPLSGDSSGRKNRYKTRMTCLCMI